MMEFRNAHFNSHGTIDCEINHPNFGWIPYTADDGSQIFDEAQGIAAPFVPPPPPPEPTPEEALADERAAVEAARRRAYITESDPLFFKWQAGEAQESEWQERRADIRARYPYPE